MLYEQEQEIIEPQEGYQTNVLSSEADIVISGAAAGVGKTFALLLEFLRNTNIPNFGGVIFRRTSPQIRAEGGLWDASMKIYNKVSGAIPTQSRLEWNFGNNVSLKFSHLEYEQNVHDWQGSEIALIGFDELTHFSKFMFFYLMTRNRSTCGVKPYIRATCNPDPDSWVRQFIDWWIGPDGFPIPEREGVIRYFMVDNNNYIMGATPQEVIEKGWHVLQPIVEQSGIDPVHFIKSLTFISGNIYQNKKLLEVDPGYLGNLNAQDEETKARLLGGNWNVKTSLQDIYDFHKFADIFTNEHVLKNIQAAKARLAKRLPTPEERKQRDADEKLVKRCITADIALKGSDKLFAFAWEGKMCIGFVVYPRSNGKQVIGAIKGLAIKHDIPNSSIVFDNDGVGQFVDGFIVGAVEFNNGSSPIGKANYNHLKSQCYFESGNSVGRGEYYIPPHIAKMPFDDKQTLEERMKYERKAIKRDKPDEDGKLQVIKKSEMKAFLDNQSPDVLDAFMMREFVELGMPRRHGTSDEQARQIRY